MITRIAASLVAVVLLAGNDSGHAQTSATTDPVGFVTLQLTGKAYNFIGLPLYSTVIFKGPVSGVSTSEITFDGSPFGGMSLGAVAIGAEQVPQYFIEVTSGSDLGAMIPILSNTANSVTVAENVSTFIAAEDTITLRPLHTLDSLFPNGAPLKTSGSIALADEVFIFDASTQASISFYFSSSVGQWLRGTTPNGNRSILPNQSIYIRRKPTTGATLVISGIVKLGTTGIDINHGYSLVPNPFPVAFPLSASNLHTGSNSTGVKGSGSIALADEVTIYSGSSVPKTYYYNTSNNQWQIGTTAANDAIIPVGGALLVRRKLQSSQQVPFTWVKTQPF